MQRAPANEQPLRVEAVARSFALSSPFRIARGAKTHAEVVTVRLTSEGRQVEAECVPYPRYGESSRTVLDALDPVLGEQPRETVASHLQRLGGAAANALGSALFALDHPARCRSALAGFRVLDGASTLVVDEPERMTEGARGLHAAVVKLKLAGDDRDLERLAAVHAARPDLPIWLDANEGCSPERLAALAPRLKALGVVLVEQPMGPTDEAALASIALPVPACADESFHHAGDVERVAALGYGAVNVKLDKAGGVERALDAARAAQRAGLTVVVGCMVSSSLSIAAAWTVVKELRSEGIAVPFVDLDGATFLAQDRSLDGTGWG